MINYVIKRILNSIPVFFGITIISFSVIHLAPGKPTDQVTQLNPKVSYQSRQKLEALYHLDKPLHIRYWLWVKRFLVFDFGRSYIDQRLVIDKIGERMPVTFTINLAAMLLILGITVPLGIASALKEGSFFDKATTVFVFIGFATPSFWLALFLMSLFGVQLGCLPISGIKSLEFDKFTLIEKGFDFGRHLILPVFVSAFGGLAGFSRYVRGSMLEVINKDYIRTARAKGLSERAVIYKHALRNALLPLITILGLSVPGLIGGSIIIETIFAIPGMGRLFYDSVMARDFPVIMGVLVLGALLTLIGNLIADIAYSYADPRIKYKK